MNNHISQWLTAYHDGELRPRRRALVEAHLAECPACQAELAEMQDLSALLASDPLPELRTTPEEFTAQVALRLPRQVERDQSRLRLRWLWYAVPVLILVAVAFLRTVVTISGTLSLIEQIGLNPEVVSWLVPAPQADPGLLQQISSRVLGWAVPFDSPLSFTLTLPVVLSIAYLIWLLLWWVDQNQKEEINGEKSRP